MPDDPLRRRGNKVLLAGAVVLVAAMAAIPLLPDGPTRPAVAGPAVTAAAPDRTVAAAGAAPKAAKPAPTASSAGHRHQPTGEAAGGRHTHGTAGHPPSSHSAGHGHGPGGCLTGPAGDAHELCQEPQLAGASAAQRQAALAALAAAWTANRRYADLDLARADGYAVERVAQLSKGLPHIPNAHGSRGRDDVRGDVTAPESLVYMRLASGGTALAGILLTAPRDQQAPTLAGSPIPRWHWHVGCYVGKRRVGPKPHDGPCPAGQTAQRGGYMSHYWFSHPDLLSRLRPDGGGLGDADEDRLLLAAYRVHAPMKDMEAAYGPRRR
jgi:hypothetical protein